MDWAITSARLDQKQLGFGAAYIRGLTVCDLFDKKSVSYLSL